MATDIYCPFEKCRNRRPSSLCDLSTIGLELIPSTLIPQSICNCYEEMDEDDIEALMAEEAAQGCEYATYSSGEDRVIDGSQ